MRKSRDEVPLVETWDIQSLFPTEAAWEDELEALKEDVKEVASFKGKLSTNANTLLQALQSLEKFIVRIVHIGTYAFLRTSTDGTDRNNQARSTKSAAIQAEFSARLSFFKSELIEIPTETIERFIAEEDGLKKYEKMLQDILEEKPFTLDPEVERTLAALGEVHSAPRIIYERSKTADMQFEAFKDEHGKDLPMSESLYEDRYELEANTTVRRNAYKSYINTLNRYKHTYAATYATEVTKQVTLAKLRGYDSVKHMLLHEQQVTKEMYDNQLNIIQKELAPHMRKLAKLKAEKYGLNKLHFCDLKAPLDPTYNPETTFEEAKEMILGSLKVLGPEYYEAMETAFNERWIDYADNVGKQSGAFCASPYGSHPFILLTWTNKMRGAFTLAHELGHAGHFYLANKHQNYFNTRPSTYFVEAPSTLNELLLANYLLERTRDARMKKWIISSLLDTYYHNFITHLLEGEFQRRIYALAEDGIPLTADVLCSQKQDAIEKFWGSAVQIDEGAGLTWMRQPHYYMGLYPYTYSAGLTISTVVANRIKTEGESAVENWLDVLKAGGSLKPLELAKKAGVDMREEKTISEAVAYVGSLVDQLEEL